MNDQKYLDSKSALKEVSSRLKKALNPKHYRGNSKFYRIKTDKVLVFPIQVKVTLYTTATINSNTVKGVSELTAFIENGSTIKGSLVGNGLESIYVNIIQPTGATYQYIFIGTDSVDEIRNISVEVFHSETVETDIENKNHAVEITSVSEDDVKNALGISTITDNINQVSAIDKFSFKYNKWTTESVETTVNKGDTLGKISNAHEADVADTLNQSITVTVKDSDSDEANILGSGTINADLSESTIILNGLNIPELYTLPVATTEALGGIKLFSNVDNPGTNNYPVKLNSNNKAYVNVRIPASDIHRYENMKDADPENSIVQYIGNTTESYTNGYFYKWVPVSNYAFSVSDDSAWSVPLDLGTKLLNYDKDNNYSLPSTFKIYKDGTNFIIKAGIKTGEGYNYNNTIFQTVTSQFLLENFGLTVDENATYSNLTVTLTVPDGGGKWALKNVLNSPKMDSVLIYKGTIGKPEDNPTVTSLPAEHYVGWVYVVKSEDCAYAGEECEPGDYIICNTSGSTAENSHWDVIGGENQVENKSVTLSFGGGSTTIATVDGTDITVAIPDQNTANLVLSDNATGTTDATTDTVNDNTYLNITEGVSEKTLSDSIQIKGSGATTVSANSGVLTINSDNTWQANTKTLNGYVTAPTSSNTNKVWRTNASGEPSWGDFPVSANTASLQVSDTSTRKINTSETTGNYLQFTGGTDKFTITDKNNNSFDVNVNHNDIWNSNSGCINFEGSTGYIKAGTLSVSCAKNTSINIGSTFLISSNHTKKSGGIFAIRIRKNANGDGSKITGNIYWLNRASEYNIYLPVDFINIYAKATDDPDVNSNSCTLDLELWYHLSTNSTWSPYETTQLSKNGSFASFITPHYWTLLNVSKNQSEINEEPMPSADSSTSFIFTSEDSNIYVSGVSKASGGSSSEVWNTNGGTTTIPAPGNGTLSIKSKVGSTTTDVSSFSANLSSAASITFEQGNNITLTSTSNTIKIDATNTTYNVFNGSGSGHSSGLVPDPGETSGTSKYLNEDGTWKTISAPSLLASTDITSTELSPNTNYKLSVAGGDVVFKTPNLQISNATLSAYRPLLLEWDSSNSMSSAPTSTSLNDRDGVTEMVRSWNFYANPNSGILHTKYLECDAVKQKLIVYNSSDYVALAVNRITQGTAYINKNIESAVHSVASTGNNNTRVITLDFNSNRYNKYTVPQNKNLEITISNLPQNADYNPYTGLTTAREIILRIDTAIPSSGNNPVIKVVNDTEVTIKNMFDISLTNNTGYVITGNTVELVFTFWSPTDVTFNGGEQVG